MKTTLFLLNVSRAGASIGAGKPAKKAARAIVALERDGEVVLVGSGQDNLRRHPPADDRAELAEDLVGPLVRSCRRALRAIEDPSVFLIELEVDDGVVVTARTVSDVRQDLEVTVRRLLFDWLTRREAIEADAIMKVPIQFTLAELVELDLLVRCVEAPDPALAAAGEKITRALIRAQAQAEDALRRLERLIDREGGQ